MAASASFGSQGSATSSSSVATISGLTFGTESSDRIIVAHVGLEASSITITGVTIGGVTASSPVATTGSSVLHSEFWQASVPTGTSGDVVVTLASGNALISVSTHAVYGADTTPTDTDSANASGVDISITALTIPTDGIGIAGACNGNNGTAIAWTGATSSHDTSLGAGTFRHSTAVVSAVGTNTITADGANSSNALVGVAFGPAAGASPIEGTASQTIGAVTQTSTGALALAGQASQTVGAYTQSAASKLKIKGVA